MRRLLLPALAVLTLALTACGDDDPGARPATTAPAPPPAGTMTAPEPAEEPEEAPGRILERFVAATRRDDLDTMWALLSQRSRQRLGPTIVRFETGGGGELRRQLRRFIRGRSDVFLDQPITADFAVAAYGGRVRKGTARPFAAYAAALRREPDGWRLELGGPVEVTALAPDPGARLRESLRLAAGIRSDAPIGEAGLWIDGVAVPGRMAGTGPRSISIFSNEAPRLPAGPHAAVAFASTLLDASATAWVFERRRS